MREIKFRGLGVEPRKWIYGYLAGAGQIMFWDETDNGNGLMFQVMPVTVGQYTGLKDKKGKEIYEGDIIPRTEPSKKCRWLEIIWHECGFYYKCSCGRIFTYPAVSGDATKVEVIGNIYENPELLNG